MPVALTSLAVAAAMLAVSASPAAPRNIVGEESSANHIIVTVDGISTPDNGDTRTTL